MRIPHHFVAALACAAVLAAQSPLTTTFASNNFGFTDGVVYFDLTVRTTLTIVRFDLNAIANVGAPISIDVLRCPTTYVGNESNPSAWTHLDSGTALAAGINQPTAFGLLAGFQLLPGNYGIQIKANGFGHRYTNGNVANQTFATAEMTFLGGAAQNVQYSGLLTPRVANTRIHYGVGSGTAALARQYGAGCYGFMNSYYEWFPGPGFDLQGAAGVTNSFLMNPNGLGGYVLAPGSNNWFTPVAGNLGLGDDSTSVAQQLPFTLTYPGGTTNQLRIGSNATVFPTAVVSNGFTPSATGLLAGPPCWCPAWRDLNPSLGGSVRYDVDPGNTAVYCTWLGVPTYGSTAVNNLQAAFFSNGAVEFRYRVMDPTPPTLVGFSTGNGAVDPGPIDISAQLGGGYSTGYGGPAPLLGAGSRPLVGTTVAIQLANLPASRLGVVLSSSFAQVPAIELGGFGLPGCYQHIQLAGSTTVGVTVGPGSLPVVVPPGSFYLGVELFMQGLVLGTSANAIGVETTNGMRLQVGNF